MVSRMLVNTRLSFLLPTVGGAPRPSVFALRSHYIDDRLPASAEETVKSALGERAAQAVKVFEELYDFFGER